MNDAKSQVEGYSTVMNVVSDQIAKYNNWSLTFWQLCKNYGLLLKLAGLARLIHNSREIVWRLWVNASFQEAVQTDIEKTTSALLFCQWVIAWNPTWPSWMGLKHSSIYKVNPLHVGNELRVWFVDAAIDRPPIIISRYSVISVRLAVSQKAGQWGQSDTQRDGLMHD